MPAHHRWRRIAKAGVIAVVYALALVAYTGSQPGTAEGLAASQVRAKQVTNWRGQVVKAPVGSTVRLAFRVRGGKAKSMTLQSKGAKGWRNHRTVPASVGERVTVRLRVRPTSAKWRLRVLSARGVTVRTSATVKVVPSRVRTWSSGASGEGVADGSFGAWRGSEVAIAGTWNDSYEGQGALWTLQPGYEFGSWERDLDIAIGSIYEDRGETWAAAASGAYDQRWTMALQKMKGLWANRPGTLYMRFAHEFNGDWFDWQVRRSEVQDFVTAWKRFRALQKSIMPEAKLVFCPNDGSAAALGYDWRAAFPGAQYVDLMSVSSFNQWPFVSTKAEFESKIMLTDRFGAPIGIERHRRFAKSKGLPFAISEWSSNAAMGDSPVFVRRFHAWVAEHAGRGAGRIRYEILFNVRKSNDAFEMYPITKMPKATAEYRRLF